MFTLPLEAQGVPFELRSFCRRSLPWGMTANGRDWWYNYCLFIHPTAPQGLAWFLSTAATVRRCMIFLIGCAIYTAELDPLFVDRSISGNEGESDSIPGSLLQAVDIPFFIRTDARYFSTRYREVAVALPEIIGAWFKQEKQLNVVMRAYAETLLNDGAYEESVFLGVVQVLEHFHALLFPEGATYYKRQVWKTFFSSIRGFVSSALVEAGAPLDGEGHPVNAPLLVNRIGFLNQLSLRSKLEVLLERVYPTYLVTILNNPDEPQVAIQEFAKGVATTRHFLTHYNERQARQALSNIDLRRAVSSCWAVLTYWLARRLGIDEDQAGKMALNAKDAMFLTAPRAGL
jgi:ApeA N-terminal domain 1